MRENRTYGSEGGAASNGIAPTPINQFSSQRTINFSLFTDDFVNKTFVKWLVARAI